MKTKHLALLVVSCLFLVGFKQGDTIELEAFLNARSSAKSFYGTDYVKFRLPKGTHGQVEAVKKLRRGYGIEITVLDGSKKGHKVWVYFNPKNPALKLYKEPERVPESETKKPEEAQAVTTTRAVEAYTPPPAEEKQETATPAPAPEAAIEQFVKTVEPSPKATTPPAGCPDPTVMFGNQNLTAIAAQIEEDKENGDEADDDKPSEGDANADTGIAGMPASYGVAEPFTQDASTMDPSAHCGMSSIPGDYNVTACSDNFSGRIFTLKNSGSPRTLNTGNDAYRQWTFVTDGSRQETALEIEESANPHGGASQWTMASEIMFFPRKNKPAIRKTEDGLYEVTLPNGEKVKFDKNKEIVGGVLSEGPIDASDNRFTRKFTKLNYSGSGIMLRSDQRGESTRGATAFHQPAAPVVVTWSKYPTPCRIPRADIWEQKQTVEGSEGGHNKFPTDAEFYAILRAKCGWNVSENSFR